MTKRVWIIFSTIIVGIISFFFDSEIAIAVSHIRNVILDEFFLGITTLSSAIVIFFFLTSLFLWQEHKRKWIFPLWITLGFSAIVSFILKISIKRARPFQLGIISILPVVEESLHAAWNYSFPSFQSMLVFCSVPILSKEFPKFKYVWIVFAGLVAFSRLYFGVHFLSDIVFGGLIGYLIGLLIIKLELKYQIAQKFSKRYE